MPAHQRLWPDNQHCREDRREPAIELDKEQAVAVVEPDATPHSSLQHNQLLPEGGIFRFKSAFGLEDCSQKVEDQGDQGDHHPKRDVIPSPVQCGRGFRYTQVLDEYAHVLVDMLGQNGKPPQLTRYLERSGARSDYAVPVANQIRTY